MTEQPRQIMMALNRHGRMAASDLRLCASSDEAFDRFTPGIIALGWVKRTKDGMVIITTRGVKALEEDLA
jgi:hypothetical protein